MLGRGGLRLLGGAGIHGIGGGCGEEGKMEMVQWWWGKVGD